jgi:hypothetical protein
MRAMLAAVTVAALGGGGAMTFAATHQAEPRLIQAAYGDDQAAIAPKRVIIGLDLSKSNPLIDNPAFAAKVAARIANIVRAMGFASEVHVRTFGNFDATSNNFYYDTLISTRARPDQVGAEIEKLISGTPLLVANGKWRAQDNTNILAFLDNAAESIGCSGMPTTVVLASDGIEDSEYARLQKDTAHLPAPEGRPFRGCAELQILGLGQGTRSPIETVRLRSEWSRWAAAAGFAKFTGLNDW